MGDIRVYKYQMLSRDCTIKMPLGARILSCQIQDRFPCLWAIVDTEQEQKVPRRFIGIGTGYKIPQDVELEFIATIQTGELLVHHIFEATSMINDRKGEANG